MLSKHDARKAFTLIELLVVVAIIALLISILLPSLGKARESAKRGACAANMRGIMTACKTYASTSFGGFWPITDSFYKMAANMPPLHLTSMGGTSGLPRDQESTSGNDGTGTQVSPTRSLWLLVRSGDIAIKGFICPSSDDIVDETTDTMRFYDFKGYGFLSYAYQMPLYPMFNQCRPVSDIDTDPRMVYLADKGPAIVASEVQAVESNTGNVSETIAFNTMARTPSLTPMAQQAGLSPELDHGAVRPFNSPNHGGDGEGDGQNVGRSDGSVAYARTPLAGVDGDNIYSIIGSGAGQDDWLVTSLFGGNYPGTFAQNIGVPGFRSLGPGVSSSTDSLLFP